MTHCTFNIVYTVNTLLAPEDCESLDSEVASGDAGWGCMYELVWFLNQLAFESQAGTLSSTNPILPSKTSAAYGYISHFSFSTFGKNE